jgi:hypothetical protein
MLVIIGLTVPEVNLLLFGVIAQVGREISSFKKANVKSLQNLYIQSTNPDYKCSNAGNGRNFEGGGGCTAPTTFKISE